MGMTEANVQQENAVPSDAERSPGREQSKPLEPSTQKKPPKIEELLEQVKALQTEIEEKNQKTEDYLSMLQRLQAEFENYKKRAERERIEYTEQATSQLVLKLLPVLDNFERALCAEGSDYDGFKKGVDMILSQLKGILSAEGLSAITAVGEEFDPHYHDCVITAAGDYDDDVVIEEFEKGYMFKKKVLRPSKVKVGKRGD